MSDSIRTFVAVEVADRVRDAALAVIDELAQARGDVKWVRRENLHLTLQFLGQVPAAQINDVCRAVTDAVADAEPFALEIRGAGAFPNTRRPRTVWLGVTAGRDALVAVQKRVQKALKKLGFRPEDRPFSPHLTIGRVREGGPELAGLGQRIVERADTLCGESMIREVVVFSSELARSGPTYTALCRAPLAGG
jgi:2'-5' RNA ligase